MDIKQGLSAVAAVTLGKDMTFRDYAQGAFRMRGIGKGQKVQVQNGICVGVLADVATATSCCWFLVVVAVMFTVVFFDIGLGVQPDPGHALVPLQTNVPVR